MADEFGGPIPVGPFAIIGDDSIGRGIVETLTGHRSRAVLMQNHGPFTIGATAKDAVKAAVMVEDVARTVHLARQGGPLIPIPQDAIDRLYDRYQNVYGQTSDDRRDSPVARGQQLNIGTTKTMTSTMKGQHSEDEEVPPRRSRGRRLMLTACSGGSGDSGSGDSADGGLIGVAMPTKSSERWIQDGDAVKAAARGRRASPSTCSTQRTTSPRRSRRSRT